MSAIQSVMQHLSRLGINDVSEIVYNPDYELLFEHETAADLQGPARGILTTSGAVTVDTGEFTGRSPRDKYIVRDDLTRNTLWWSDAGQGRNDNKPMTGEVWSHLKTLIGDYLSEKTLYIVDAW